MQCSFIETIPGTNEKYQCPLEPEFGIDFPGTLMFVCHLHADIFDGYYTYFPVVVIKEIVVWCGPKGLCLLPRGKTMHLSAEELLHAYKILKLREDAA